MEHGDNIIRVDHVFSGLTLSQGIGLVFPSSPTPFADNNNMTIADRKHTRKLRYIERHITKPENWYSNYLFSTKHTIIKQHFYLKTSSGHFIGNDVKKNPFRW